MTTATVLRGLSFPFRIDGGRVAETDGFRKIEEDVRHLLSVRVGERIMLRAYGGGAHAHRQHPDDRALAALVRHEIEAAFQTYMPDLRLTAPIAVSADESVLTVVIEYLAAPGDVLRRVEVQFP